MSDTNETPSMDYAQTPTIGALAEALAAAQAEMGHAAKDSTNPHFGSRYADLASVREAIAPLARHKIAVSQQVLSRDDGAIGLRTLMAHASGEWLSSVAYLKPERPGPQAAGSVLTYLRRYTLAAIAGIAQDDDDGNAASEPPRAPAPKNALKPAAATPTTPPPATGSNAPTAAPPPTGPKTASNQQLKALAAAMTACGLKDRDTVLAWCSGHLGKEIQSRKDLTEAEASKLIDKANAGEMPGATGEHGGVL